MHMCVDMYLGLGPIGSIMVHNTCYGNLESEKHTNQLV